MNLAHVSKIAGFGGGLNVDTITANNIGTQTDSDLLQLTDNNLLVNGSISGSTINTSGIISGSSLYATNDIYAAGDIYINGNQQIARGTGFYQEVNQIISTISYTWDLTHTPIDYSENVYFMYQMPNWEWNEIGDPTGLGYDYTLGNTPSGLKKRITFNSEIIFRKGDVLSIQYQYYI